MPTYKNVAKRKVFTIEGSYVNPGEIIQTPFYYYIENLTKIDEKPFYFNPIAYYNKKYGNINDICEIDIPEELWKNYEIGVIVLKGGCELRFNSIENNPPLILRKNIIYKEFISDGRRVDNLKIKFIENSSEIEIMILKK